MKKNMLFILPLLIIGIIFYNLSEIIVPFVFSIFVGYAFSPLLKNSTGVKANALAFIYTVLFFSVLAGMTIFIIPIIIAQLKSLAANIPKLHFDISLEDLSYIAKEKFSSVFKVMSNLLSSSIDAVSSISLILLTPIISFYLIRDWNKFSDLPLKLIPKDYQPIAREYTKLLDKTLSSYLRGQLSICIIQSVVYTTAFCIIGLPSGFALGILTGLLSFIPYVGAIISGVLCLLIAAVEMEPTYVVIVLSIFVVAQTIEANFLIPTIIVDRLGIHPVWLIFGMLACAIFFNFFGIFCSVPITAMLYTTIRFFYPLYYKSTSRNC